MSTLDELKSLLPSQFDEVLARYNIPTEQLPPGSQVQRGILLIKYAEAQNDLAQLDAIIAAVKQKPSRRGSSDPPWLWKFIIADTIIVIIIVLAVFRESIFPPEVELDPTHTGPGVVVLERCSPTLLAQADDLSSVSRWRVSA